jgi:Ohr subfamily peroxiredoxin
MKTLYTAEVLSSGGRKGQVQTADGKLSFHLAPPGESAQKTGVWTNPEDLFACAYAACFGSALEHVVGGKNISMKDATVKAEVSLNSDQDGYYIGAVLDVSIPGVDIAEVEKLVEAAHQICPYSKATRGNIEVTLKVNNHPLSKAA